MHLMDLSLCHNEYLCCGFLLLHSPSLWGLVCVMYDDRYRCWDSVHVFITASQTPSPPPSLAQRAGGLGAEGPPAVREMPVLPATPRGEGGCQRKEQEEWRRRKGEETDKDKWNRNWAITMNCEVSLTSAMKISSTAIKQNK